MSLSPLPVSHDNTSPDDVLFTDETHAGDVAVISYSEDNDGSWYQEEAQDVQLEKKQPTLFPSYPSNLNLVRK